MELLNVSLGICDVTINGIHVKDFMDEGNPIEMIDCETTNIEWSCNGRMIRTVKPSAVMLSVTVAPGSYSDEKLYDLLKKGFSNGGAFSSSDEQLTASLVLSTGGSVNLSNGTCLSGPAGYSASGPAKLAGNTYTFAFECV